MSHLFRICFVVSAICVSGPLGSAQEIPAYDLGGARKPNPDMSFRKEKQYKRVHQVALRHILRNKIETAESFLQRYLKKHPGDAETLYMLGVLNAQRGDLSTAEEFLGQAVEGGLPADRLIAGPRDLLRPVRDSALVRQVRSQLSDRPVHGPLLGSATATSVSAWVRTADATSVQLVVRRNDGRSPLKAGPIAHASVDSDYTAVCGIAGLNPGTRYDYAIRIGNGALRFADGQTFRTLPAAGQAGRFRLAFGGGAGFVPPHERMWDTIRGVEPDLMLLLGDNVYIDDPESVLMQQYTYQRRQSRPEWRALTARTPVFTIWDDHDFSVNDSWGGPAIDVPFWKKDWSFETFRQNWANPGYAGGDEQPGCWYRFQVADVDFIMLDCRYYRTNPQESNPSMLGPVQLKWLKQQLTDCTGTFKVLCSSVPWDFRTKGDSLDTWNGYRDERNEILDFIGEQKIEGVVLISADRHRSDAWKIERDGLYGLYEFMSSRLTNQHVHPRMEQAGAIFSYNELQSFGLVTFDTTQEDPSVQYDIINIDGETVYTMEFPRSELTFP